MTLKEHLESENELDYYLQLEENAKNHENPMNNWALIKRISDYLDLELARLETMIINHRHSKTGVTVPLASNDSFDEEPKK